MKLYGVFLLAVLLLSFMASLRNIREKSRSLVCTDILLSNLSSFFVFFPPVPVGATSARVYSHASALPLIVTGAQVMMEIKRLCF